MNSPFPASNLYSINPEVRTNEMLTKYENMIYPVIRVQSRKKYISAAFWNYISTPINFIVTLFTGLTAGQAGSTNSYLDQKTVFVMLFVCFILSTINIFFKLKEKAELNYLSAKSYEAFGNQFMKINVLPQDSPQEIDDKLAGYIELKKKIDEFMSQEKVEGVNYFTEFLYFCVQKQKSRKIINILFENAKGENNEIFRQRIQVLAELKRTGVISGQEFNLILASLNETAKEYIRYETSDGPNNRIAKYIRNMTYREQPITRRAPIETPLPDYSPSAHPSSYLTRSRRDYYEPTTLQVNDFIQRTPPASFSADELNRFSRRRSPTITRSRANSDDDSFASDDGDDQGNTWTEV